MTATTLLALFSVVIPSVSSQNRNTSWTTAKWASNDAQFAAARANIDDDFAHNRITASYLARLEKKWTENQKDPKSVFSWAYTSYRAKSLHPPLSPNSLIGPGVFNAAPANQNYQYARVRFLNETIFGPHRKLKAVGDRLLAHTPNDFDVEYAYASCLGGSLSAQEKQDALAYVDKLIQKYPTKPSVYGVKGGIYLSYWVDHRNKQDAQDAIKWYQEYLRIAPANDGWRKQAQTIITVLQSHI